MSALVSLLLLAGGATAAVAAIGLVRFRTPEARLHAAGKISPLAIVLVAAGASLELGAAAAARLGVAVGALVVTLPVSVHVLFRAAARSRSGWTGASAGVWSPTTADD